MAGVSFTALKVPRAGQSHRKAEVMSKWKDLFCGDKNGADIQKIAKNRVHVGPGFMVRDRHPDSLPVPILSSQEAALNSVFMSTACP